MFAVQEYSGDSMFIWVCTLRASGSQFLQKKHYLVFSFLECKTWPSVLLNKEGLINALGEAYNISVLGFCRWQRFFKFSCSFTLSKQTEFPNHKAHKLCMQLVYVITSSLYGYFYLPSLSGFSLPILLLVFIKPHILQTFMRMIYFMLLSSCREFNRC